MKRCLFVDDSQVILRVARHILTITEIHFMEASSGEDALHVCRLEVPDVVVIDTTLSDMDPVDLVRRLRALDTDGSARIIVSLNQLDVSLLTRAKRAGADGYMLKPFDRAQLLLAMRTFDLPVPAYPLPKAPPQRAKAFATIQGTLSA